MARLRDLGFVAGTRCEVIARMWLGGDPLVVRIGGSTFALRRAEAGAVQVVRQQERLSPRAAMVAKGTSAVTAYTLDPAGSTSPLRIALGGVPNCRQTALFNPLTGCRQK